MNKKEDKKLETAVLGGGCFWCQEALYLRIKGVINVVSGYAGGEKINPTYEEVSGGQTGHAETVKVEFEPGVISYENILSIFFSVHDPTTINRQGSDTGPQYRSIILYADENQEKSARKIIADLNKQKIYEKPIVTELKPLEIFYPAEVYHQRYFEKNPQAAYCQIIINPKLKKLKEKFKKYYKS